MGLQLYDGNPNVDNNPFEDFYDGEYKLAGAIGFPKPHAVVISTLFTGSRFNFEDGVEGKIIKGQDMGQEGVHRNQGDRVRLGRHHHRHPPLHRGQGPALLHQLPLLLQTSLGEHERLSPPLQRGRGADLCRVVIILGTLP